MLRLELKQAKGQAQWLLQYYKHIREKNWLQQAQIILSKGWIE